MKLFRLSFLFIACLSLTCCGSRNKGNNNNNNSVNYETVTKTIGADGGEIKDKDSNIEVNIPAGALSGNKNISVQYVGEAATFSEAPTINFLAGAEFGPSGTTFDKPVEVSLKLDKTPINKELSIFCYDEVNNVWDFVTPAKVKNQVATFEITHFSKYQCLDLSITTFDQYVYIVREACNGTKSDQWISDTYLDYLLNDIHIMDYYSEHMGYVYRAKGFIVDGEFEVFGRKNDPNKTQFQYGESNQIGYASRCGYTIDAGLLSSYQEFVKQRDKAAQENQEIIYVGMCIYYDLVKPIIDVKAAETTLRKNESTVVTVHCHYTDEDNYFPQNREINLAHYYLTLPWELKHLKPSVKEFYTDENGIYQFKVRSLDGETETIKVMFYVEGTFGEYAAGYAEIGKKTQKVYNVTGHISYRMAGEYYLPITSIYTITDSASFNGTIAASVDFDIEGTITWDEWGNFEGELGYSAGTASVSSSPAEVSYTEVLVSYPESYVNHVTERYQIFSDNPSCTTAPLAKKHYVGMLSDYYTYSAFEEPTFHELFDFESYGSYYAADSNDSSSATFQCSYGETTSIIFFMDTFKLQTGTQTFVVDNALIGSMSVETRYDIAKYQNITRTITQTITITEQK